MKVQLTRDSVAMGDDCDAPHTKTITVPDSASLKEILQLVFRSGYLAQIAGGQATWSAVSRIPVAILAQQWAEPKMFDNISGHFSTLNFTQNTLFLHFTYHTQKDPDSVYEQLLSRRVL